MKDNKQGSAGEGPLIPDVVVYSVGSCMLFVLVSIQLVIWLLARPAGHTESRKLASRSTRPHPAPIARQQAAGDEEQLPIRQQDSGAAQQRTPETVETENQQSAAGENESADGESAAPPVSPPVERSGQSGRSITYAAGWIWLLRSADYPESFSYKGNIAALDLDGDDNDELLVHNPLNSSISYFGLADRSLLAMRQNERLLGEGSQLVYGWDHDGDRREDAVVDRPEGASLFSQKLGRIELSPPCRVERRQPPADYDGDGFADLLCLGLHEEWYEVRSWPAGALLHGPPDSGSGLHNFTGFADFDADGRAEVLEWDATGRRMLMTSWDPDKAKHGKKSRAGRIDLGAFPAGFRLGALDINGDGTAELFSESGWFDAVAQQQTGLWSGWSSPDIGQYLLVNFAACPEPLGVAVPRLQGGDDAVYVFDARGNVLLSSRPAGNIASVCVARLDGRELCLVATQDGVVQLDLRR